MTTASADFSPNFKPKKKKRPLPAMFRAQRLHAGAEVDADAIERIVDEEVDRLLEGGPGSGRYPAGSGEHPDSGMEAKRVTWHKKVIRSVESNMSDTDSDIRNIYDVIDHLKTNYRAETPPDEYEKMTKVVVDHFKKKFGEKK